MTNVTFLFKTRQNPAKYVIVDFIKLICYDESILSFRTAALHTNSADLCQKGIFMNTLIDKCILLLFCLLGLLFVPLDSNFIIALLAAVTLSSLFYAFSDRNFQLAGITLYSAFVFFIPEFCLFLPLIIYDYPPEGFFENPEAGSLRTRIPAALLLLAGIIFQYHNSIRLIWLFFLMIGCMLALLLYYRSYSCAVLSYKYRKTRDDDTELQLLLKEKNQSLLEKQDSEIYAATLRERNRIAREIHDNVGHMLTRSILMVGALKTINKESSLAEPLNQLDTTLNQAMNSIRQSVHDLHDSSVNLRDSLQTLIREFTFCPVTLTYEMSPDLPRDVKYSFISIAKEALVNIARHSNATKASITAQEHPGFYQFIVWDNGTTASSYPADTYTEPAFSSGIGLSNIQNRVKALNGNIRIQTKSGFRIYITIPKS